MRKILELTFFMVFTAVLFAETVEVKASSSIANAGTAIELSVIGRDGVKFTWDDGGAGGIFEAVEAKAKWTAPATAPKQNPVTITAAGKDDTGNTVLSGTKAIAVLGGPIESQPVICYCDGPGAPRLFKGAPNQLKDVKYKWVAAKGDDLALTNDDLYSSGMKIKAKKSSVVEDNNEIKLIYTLLFDKETKSYEALKKVTVYQPCALKEVSRKLKQDFGPDIYGYSLYVTYQLIEQFGKPLQVEGIHIEESLKMQKNPLRFPQEDFQFRMNGFNTDADGRFNYGMTVVKSNPLPENFEVQVLQELKIRLGGKDVQGCIVRKNELSYKRETADVTEVREEK